MGGDPVAHTIRDISSSGLYVLTGERWYPGTVIRMTLADRRQPSAERSITVYAGVVRWGNDGVGLQFLVPDGKNMRRGVVEGASGPTGGASRAQITEFMAKLRSAGS